MPRIAPILIFVFSVALAAPFAAGSAADPIAEASFRPTAAQTETPGKIARKEVRRIRRKFADLLDQERDRLRGVQRRQRRAGTASRKLRMRDWEAKEKVARRKFFAENPHGPERREYVKDLIARRKAFSVQLKAEERQERSALESQWKALKESQRARLESVEAYLRRSERPLAKLLEPAD
jgi:hypothetical protein